MAAATSRRNTLVISVVALVVLGVLFFLYVPGSFLQSYLPYDENEPRMPQCSDDRDNDGDGKIDYPADSGCTSYDDTSEAGSTACGDGIDNDMDGTIDHPQDPGCSASSDIDELGQVACDDGIDNDGDTLIDFRPGARMGVGSGDPGCGSLTDTDEEGIERRQR